MRRRRRPGTTAAGSLGAGDRSGGADRRGLEFDAPKLFAAHVNTLRWNCVTSTDPTLFQSPYRAGHPARRYQLEPLRHALLLPRVNLFIAGNFGLGKTIEAGLIARELLLRKKCNDRPSDGQRRRVEGIDGHARFREDRGI